MILADTSIWIDYLRGRRPEMQALLNGGRIAMHPYIIAEIALGSLQHRQRTFALMESLWQANAASLEEVRSMIEAHKLYSQGIGLTDTHLIAACLLTPGVTLWTRDTNLHRVAAVLGVQANFA